MYVVVFFFKFCREIISRIVKGNPECIFYEKKEKV